MSALLTMTFLCACVTSKGISEKQRELDGHERTLFGISGAAFSPDSRTLAIGSGHLVYVLEVNSGDLLHRLPFGWNARFGRTRSLTFISNTHLVAAAQGAIRVWDIESGYVVHRLDLKLRSQLPRAIAWSGESKTLALTVSDSSSPIQLIRVDDSGFGSLTDIVGVGIYPRDLVFSRDGRYLAAGGDGEGVLIWDVQSSQLVGELPTSGSVGDLELIGYNQLLVAGAEIDFWTFLGKEQDIEIMNPSLDGQINAQITTKVAGVIAYGLLGVLGGMVGSPYAGDSIMGAVEFAKLPVTKNQQSWCGRSTTISPDGKLLVDVYPGISKEVIRVYELERPNHSRDLNPRGGFSCVAKFSPNGKQLLITTEKVVSLYDTSTWHQRSLEIN